MIAGRFGEIGELIFEIELIGAERESYPVEVLLNTGFTTGWLAFDSERDMVHSRCSSSHRLKT
jgi:predicted aspartyl protease